MSFDVSKHTGLYHSCTECTRKRWQAADFTRTAAERWVTPPLRRNAQIGASVRTRLGYGFNVNGGGRFLVRDIVGTIWSEAPEGLASSKGRAYWITDGRHYYVALASDLEQLEERAS